MKKIALALVTLALACGVQAKEFVLDVRTPGEIAQTGKIPGALVADFYAPNFRQMIESFGFNPKEDTIAVYCRSGRRAGAVLHMLKDYGFTDANLVNLGGAYDASKTLNMPLVR